jgi:hypothetical protein
LLSRVGNEDVAQDLVLVGTPSAFIDIFWGPPAELGIAWVIEETKISRSDKALGHRLHLNATLHHLFLGSVFFKYVTRDLGVAVVLVRKWTEEVIEERLVASLKCNLPL